MTERYMLDTDICSYVMRENPASLIEKFKEHPENLYMSSITFAELLYGAAKKNSEKLTDQIMRFMSLVSVISWDTKAANSYAFIRSYLEKSGSPIDNMDLLIAASALSNGYILVSNNTRHFKNISGLALETWL